MLANAAAALLLLRLLLPRLLLLLVLLLRQKGLTFVPLLVVNPLTKRFPFFLQLDLVTFGMVTVSQHFF